MLTEINGLHHVTALASGAQANNAFFTRTLGLRRVKKTVNFDAPEVYHLYYGDAAGTPGTVMTYFPFPDSRRGRAGTGEVSATAFAVPHGALPFWQARLSAQAVAGLERSERFGEARLNFRGPDGEGLALVETSDARQPWTAGIPEAAAIRGFHSVELRLTPQGAAATAELLRFMGYRETATQGAFSRFELGKGGPAQVIEIAVTEAAPAEQGAGSVHHIAFSVDDRAAQDRVRKALIGAGHEVTGVKDRDYFWAIYFRSPGGILFEVATNEPGFDRDEDPAHLGEALKLPDQHAHLRDTLERTLEPIGD